MFTSKTANSPFKPNVHEKIISELEIGYEVPTIYRLRFLLSYNETATLSEIIQKKSPEPKFWRLDLQIIIFLTITI